MHVRDLLSLSLTSDHDQHKMSNTIGNVTVQQMLHKKSPLAAILPRNEEIIVGILCYLLVPIFSRVC